MTLAPSKAVNVHIVTNNTVNVTRRGILTWLASLLDTDIKRIEDLSNGAVYCRVMEILFPGSIPLNRVKVNTKHEGEAILNYKLLQNAFRQYEVRKDIPVNNLVKGVFSENFRFAQWFKLFYEANMGRTRTLEYVYEEDQNAVQNEKRLKPAGEPAPTSEPKSPSVAGDQAKQQSSHGCVQNVLMEKGEQTTSPCSQARKAYLNGPSPRPNPREQGPPFVMEDEITSETSGISAPEIYDIPSPVKKEPIKTVTSEPSSGIPAVRSDFIYVSTSPMSNQGSTSREICASDQANGMMVDKRTSPPPPPCPKRRVVPTRHQGNSGVQLPPPSPYQGSQHNTGNSRSVRRGLVTNGWCQNQGQFSNVLAAGDRPTNSTGNTSPPEGQQRRTSDGSGHPNPVVSPTGSRRQNMSINSGLQQLSPGVIESKPTPDSSEEKLVKEVSPAVCEQPITQNLRSTSSVSSPKSTKQRNSQTSLHATAKRVDSSTQHHESQLPSDHEFVPVEQMSEELLQRELAILRYETIGQRRSLFYCQKEAQFYFKKLRQIEDLCLQLSELKDKSHTEILEAIFGILYETEEGFASPGECQTCS
ncbi:unnamed protein product [Calicophoron daubneyi]|uniref:Uncharacterized protein n=1 Tax=Calicophoron daubneyi TaxID=300641 RepID=A0AAV2TIA6_CALDB